MLYDTFTTLDRELSRLDSMLSGPAAQIPQAPMDVRREADRYVVEMELPGVDPSSIDVTLQDGWLSVKADRSSTRETKERGWVVRERSHAAVERGFVVDRTVDADAIAADYANGVLTLTLPIAEEAKPRRIALTGATASRELGAGSGAKAMTTHAKSTEKAPTRGKAEPAHSVMS